MHLTTFDASQLLAAKQLLDLQFGVDYLTEQDLLLFTQGKHIGWVACSTEGELIGISLVKLGTAASLAAELLIEKDWFVSTFRDKEPIALRKHLAIAPQWQGKGIGKKLVQHGIEQLRQLNSSAIVSIVWKESAGKSLGKLLKNLGATPVRTIAGYWKSDSLEKQYDCPVCGLPPCSCSATIYVIE